MNRSSAARPLLIALAALGALKAQGAQPRFVLPSTTVDYRVVAPAGHPGLSLPTGNDDAARQQANERATLGRVLFHDQLLSRSRQRVRPAAFLNEIRSTYPRSPDQPTP